MAAALLWTGAVAGVAQAAPASLLADHPLSGTLWHTHSGEAVDESRLLTDAIAADWVLLGEKHDNAEHHRLQAKIVGGLGAAGRRLAVVWEMAEPQHAQALYEARIETVDTLGSALEWSARGWPDWSEYQPIAEKALAYGMPMVPGKPSRTDVRSLARGEALAPEEAERLLWSRRYSPEVAAALREELAQSHCGALPETALGPMAEVQRFWDAWMAAQMRDAAASGKIDGAILIAGSGHVREDRAVPWFLPGDSLSVALVEVVRGRHEASDYPAFDAALFDYVWFTPRVDEDDPCAAFLQQRSDQN